MDQITTKIPLLLRSIHSAPMGIYSLEQLLRASSRLGYSVVGIADRESLAGLVELNRIAAALNLQPIYGMEVFADPEKTFPAIFLALDSIGYRQLLNLYTVISSEDYHRQGLEILPEHPQLNGAGMVCLVEPPGTPSVPGESESRQWLKRWTVFLQMMMQHLPQAQFCLRIPENTPAHLIPSIRHLANRTGLTPLVMPLAAFLNSGDAPLYAAGREQWLSADESHRPLAESPCYPPLSEDYFQSLLMRAPEKIEKTPVASSSPALENTGRLLERLEWEWRLERFQEPQIQLERGFNPETGLWDRIQQAGEERWADRISTLKEQLYEEFSSLRRQGRINLFLTLCELFSRLSRPELVALPDRLTRGLLCCQLMGLTPIDTGELDEPFDEESVKTLRSPILLRIPDGFHREILDILAGLFGEPCLGILPRDTPPSTQSIRNLAVSLGVQRHPLSIHYLRKCLKTDDKGAVLWVLVVSRPLEGEIPGVPAPPPFQGWTQLGIDPDGIINLPGIVFELSPDPNLTRLCHLIDPSKPMAAGVATGVVSEKLIETIRQILPLLYPRYGLSLVNLVFHLMQPRNWAELLATLALLELERHDRPAFLRALKLRWQIEQKQAASIDRVLQLEQGRKHLADILNEGKGLFLFRHQLIPLFEKVIGLSAPTSAQLVKQVLAGGSHLPPTDQINQRIVALLEDPELSYPVTQFLSLLPRYLSPRQQMNDWAKNLAQFARLAEENPLAFAREILNESSQPSADIPPLQIFLQQRGFSLLPPDINRSLAKCSVENTGLRLGFSLIENIGPVTSRHLMEQRGQRPFESLDALLRRTSRRLVNRRVLRELALAGATDCLGNGMSPARTRAEIISQVERIEEKIPSGPDLQTYLFEIKTPPKETPIRKEEIEEDILQLIRQESRIYGAPLTTTIQQALGDIFSNCRLPLELPSSSQWWFHRRMLQAGVLLDIWDGLGKGREHYSLGHLCWGSGCLFMIGDPALHERLLALSQARDESGEPALILTLGSLGGKKWLLERFTFGMLPPLKCPEMLQSIPHYYLEDFESVQSLVEGARHWSRLEVQLEQAQSRLAQRLKNVIQPFRMESMSKRLLETEGMGCRLRFHSSWLDKLPKSVRQLEEIPLLPSQMLLRQIELVEGVHSARFVEKRQKKDGQASS